MGRAEEALRKMRQHAAPYDMDKHNKARVEHAKALAAGSGKRPHKPK